MFSPGPRRRRSCDGSLEGEGVWRWTLGVWRGAAVALAQDLEYFFPVRGRPKHRLKQAAPGNYPARVFVQRSVRLFHFTRAQQTNHALDRSREPPVKKDLSHRRAERNRARSLGCESKRLPSSRRTHTRQTSPLDQSPNARYIAEARERFILPRSG